jgi:hypothetical protein
MLEDKRSMWSNGIASHNQSRRIPGNCNDRRED